MLRITVREELRSVTFQLEGRLAGRWVRELEECWQRTVVTQQRRIVRVDLAGVTFVDAEGEAYLAVLHQHGAELVAADCLTKAVVDEITQGQPPNSNRPK
jgi:anti-anti-sigma regulatory factor